MPVETVTRETILAEVERLDSAASDSQRETAAILLSSLVVGARNNAIAAFLDIPLNRVRRRSLNLRRNGIWQGNKVDAQNWFDKDAGSTTFILHSLVADGLMERTKGE